MLPLGIEDFHHHSFDNDDLDDWASIGDGSETLEDILNFVDKIQRTIQHEFRAKQSKILSTTDKLKQGLSKQGFKKSLEGQVATLRERFQKPPVVAFLDKICFFVSVHMLCLVVWMIFMHPVWVPTAYFWAFVTLVGARVYAYRRRGWGYFTLDLCYFVNVSLILVLFVFKSHVGLLAGVFSLVHGPVIWAVVQWKNSLVFHSLDKITSCFIHVTPCIVLYTLKWIMKDEDFMRRHHPAFLEPTPPLINTAFWAGLLYIIWQVSYYAVVDILNREKCRTGLRVTSYTYIAAVAETKQGLMHWALHVFGPNWKYGIFMILQFGYSLLTIIPTPFCWRNQTCHFALLTAMFTVAVWNGADYYVEVFGKSYAKYYREIHEKFVDAYRGVATAASSGSSSPAPNRVELDEEDLIFCRR